VTPAPRSTTLLAIAGGLAAAMAVVAFAAEFGTDVSGLAWSLPYLSSYAAGVVAVRRLGDHRAARRLLAFGTVGTLWITATVLLAAGFDDHGRQWWLGPANVVLQILGLGMGAAMIALVAVYPEGRYGLPWARRLVRAVTVMAVAVPLGLLLARPSLLPAWAFAWSGPDEAPFPDVASPLHLGFLAPLGTVLSVYHDAALALAPTIAGVLVALRCRRLTPEQRLRWRWPLYGVLVVLVAPASTLLLEAGLLSQAVSYALVILALVALPVAAGIGLVQPRLFDVDRVARRSLVFVPLWVAIAAAYIGAAAALGHVASDTGVQVAIVLTILATIGLEPVRRVLARRAAGWAYGESIGGDELIRRLGATLEHALDLEQLLAGVAAIARDGMGVRWTRIDVAGVPAASDGDVEGPAALSAPIVHGGERLGEIACGPRVRGDLRAADRELLATLARQTALAIHNARQASDLAASRARIVAAHEEARREIERDIHDGAQQELVALIARIGLARQQLGRDPARIDETLVDLRSEVRQALANLRELAAGIHPSVLADHGLIEAIEIRCARLPIGVTIECDAQMRTTRLPAPVEGAAYFFVSEGLANALKHSGAERARVRVVLTERELAIEVADDGCGFDADAVAGTGLRGLADRLETLGGTLRVDAAPGRGTRLAARLPIGAPAAV
jgi:signal transduction histidine kinase